MVLEFLSALGLVALTLVPAVVATRQVRNPEK
jgi:hypothetical protein